VQTISGPDARPARQSRRMVDLPFTRRLQLT
jgi:hypothetical protein